MASQKPVKVDPEIRVKRHNLKDVIRDEIYGAGVQKGGEVPVGGRDCIIIPTSDVKRIAKRIAKRVMIGPT